MKTQQIQRPMCERPSAAMLWLSHVIDDQGKEINFSLHIECGILQLEFFLDDLAPLLMKLLRGETLYPVPMFFTAKTLSRDVLRDVREGYLDAESLGLPLVVKPATGEIMNENLRWVKQEEKRQ